MTRKTNKVFAFVATLAFAWTAMACPLAYVVNFSGQFGILDLATGAFTPVGPGLENVPDGIMGAAGGPFYSVDGVTGHLLRIEADGKVTDVGDTKTGPQMGPDGISIIGALTDGTLYALDFSNNLFKIDPASGSLTKLGALPALPPQEMDYSGNLVTSFNGNATRLFFTIEIFEGPRKTGPTLYTIDPVTLAVTSRALELPGRVIGSGMVNDNFYLFSAEGQIIKLNTATGETAVAANYDSGLTEDGPPLTGIFGVVGAAEPNAIGASPAAAARPTKSHGKWPPRYVPLPSRVR